MYDIDNLAVNNYSQANANNCKDMVTMVALSIQQPWSSVGTQLQSVRDEGADSRFLWGNKANTYAYLQTHGTQLYDALCEADTDEERMLAALQVPGLGLPKAGFVVQLFSGGVGCIDVHNLRRLSIPATVLKISMKSSQATIERRTQAYMKACAQRKSEWLWNSWCKLVADKYPTHWRDANHVSQVHHTYLTGE